MLFSLPILLSVFGGLSGYWCARRSKGLLVRTRFAIGIACILVVCSALIAMSGQIWYDLGLSYEAIRVAESTAFVVFAFVLVGTWTVLYPSKHRWWLLAAVPVGLAQPLLSVLAMLIWSINGFAS
jgi:hypothetical protein